MATLGIAVRQDVFEGSAGPAKRERAATPIFARRETGRAPE